MSIKEAKLIIDEYNLNNDEQSFEIALEAVNKFGSAKDVIIEGLKPEYKYLKKLSKLLAMLDPPQSSDIEAEKIATLMHDIHKVVLRDAEQRDEDFMELMRRINVRKSFHPTEKELWVMQYIGGRELIANINYEDPNQLLRRIRSALEKYNQLDTSQNSLVLGKQSDYLRD